MILKKMCQSSVISVLSRNISYVERSRLLEKIKTNEDLCSTVMKESRFLMYNKGKPLLKKSSSGHSPMLVSYDECRQWCGDDVDNKSVVLSVSEDGLTTFAAPVSPDQDTVELESRTLASFTDLRVVLFLVNQEVAHTLSKGWSLLTWRRNTKFCSVCGSDELEVSRSGSGAKCSKCGHVSYPVTSPVGIVSVSDGSGDNLLLIRQPRYPPGMYSCIAGFLDAGESLEDCVKREVAEEVGLEVESVEYKCSQHWPFPSGSLMIGCHSRVSGVTPDPDPCTLELEDARWFSRDEVQEAVERIDKNPRLRVGRNNDPKEIFIAPKGALAYSLITKWLEK